MNPVVKRKISESETMEGLIVQDWDLYIRSNRLLHRTSEYEHELLIARRGQAFALDIGFNRDVDPVEDEVILQFAVGAKPRESKGSLQRLRLATRQGDNNDKWHATLLSQKDGRVGITVTPSREAIVGKYTVEVHVTNLKTRYQQKQAIGEMIVLFNPWCAEDQVYVENEAERQEYVLNETGLIWVGESDDYSAASWIFGQFDDVSLNAALYLLEKASPGKEPSKANPVQVIRKISAMVNHDDDDGVLHGKWNVEVWPEDCTPPGRWFSSVDILKQYMEKKVPVKYGQCWVFSAVVTTLLRALGIATRSVTNFQSNHDFDGSMTCDSHVDEDGEKLKAEDDTVWNFHVWNESWLKRADLPDGYDGWQAHDGTPQELSGDIYRCGPASVKAIKEGHVYLPHDCPFIFAEVNGERMEWLMKNDGSLELLEVKCNDFGINVSTKAIGTDERSDLTNDYKYPYGSKEGEAALARAYQFSSRSKHNLCQGPPAEIAMSFLDIPPVTMGEDFDVRILLENRAQQKRHLHLRLQPIMVYYTGSVSEKMASQCFDEVLPGKGQETLVVHMAYNDFKHLLRDGISMKLYLTGKVQETDRRHAASRGVTIHPPKLALSAPAMVRVGEEFQLEVSLYNPLPDAIPQGTFRIHTVHGLNTATDVAQLSIASLPPRETSTGKIAVTATRAGVREIHVVFECITLPGVHGKVKVDVQPAENQ